MGACTTSQHYSFSQQMFTESDRHSPGPWSAARTNMRTVNKEKCNSMLRIRRTMKKNEAERGGQRATRTQGGREGLPRRPGTFSPPFLHVRLTAFTSSCFARGLPSHPSLCIMFTLVLRAGEALGITQLPRETCHIINSLEPHHGQKEPRTCTGITKHRPGPLWFPVQNTTGHLNMVSE